MYRLRQNNSKHMNWKTLNMNHSNENYKTEYSWSVTSIIRRSVASRRMADRHGLHVRHFFLVITQIGDCGHFSLLVRC